MAIDFPSSPTNGQTFTSGSVTYTWDGTKWTAVAAGGGGATDLDGLTDVTITTPSNSQVLSYNGTQWVNAAAAGGGGDAITEGNTSAEVIDTGSDGRFVVTTEGVPRATVDSSGRLLVGTSTSRTNYALQLEGTNYNQASLSLINNQNTGNSGYLTFGKSRGATVGSNTIVNANDPLGIIEFSGADGNALQVAALIRADVDGTPGANDMPGRLMFSTTADGASSPSTRMTLYSNGSIRAVETASAYFYPGIDNSIYLGSPSFRYNLVYSVNGTASSSDEREKTEINDAALGIDFIKSLRPVSYKWKVGHNDVEAGDEGDVVIPRPGLRTHWGFLAQDVKQAADQAGVDFGGWILTNVDDPESPQGLRYQQFIAPLTKALQEAIAKIETLEAKVAALEAA